MNVVLHYRHDDGRMIELVSDGSKVELWQLLPHRELVSTHDSVDAGKEGLPEGFEPDKQTFMPPCPKCNEVSPMSLDTGMYMCPECDTEF